jgi:3-deoxy-D-manno-octulosonic-acid transferase
MSRLILVLYNLLFIPALLLLLPGYLLRIKKRGGYGHKAAQRLGLLDQDALDRIGTGRIWIHAVSVGEVGIALKFIREFHIRNHDARFLVSSTTSTGLAILERSASPWLEPIANPVDFPVITGRLLKRLRPSALLFVEADLWPNRIAAAKKLGTPVVLLNARLSSRSERRFRMLGPLASAWFNQLKLITLSDVEDRERFLSLGVRPDILRVTGNIKHDSPPGALSPKAEAPLFLAASTHAGEEEEIAEAYRVLRNEYPGLQLVIAPRHVERRDEIRQALAALGLPCHLRSEGGGLSMEPLLLDTTGELSSWYPKATVVFVGKSLLNSVNKGGQNMIEPLQAGAPVLIGPHTSNFEPLATRLCEAGAALRVNDHREIIADVQSLLGNDAKRAAMISAATDILKPHQGAARHNCELIERLMGGSPLHPS